MIRIDKERTWVFSPVNNIAMKAEIAGNISQEQLRKAILQTVNSYEMLHQRVVFDSKGYTYFDSAELFEPVIQPLNGDWKKVAEEQQKIPFAIDRGELLRFFYQMTQTGISLLLIAHHIAGDGVSYVYFIRDLMRSLSGEGLEYKKLKLIDMSALPKTSRLRFPITWLLISMNRKWRKNGRMFGFDEYYKMYQNYWSEHETVIETYSFEDKEYDSICNYAKVNHITVNTLITTALIQAAGEKSDVGLAVSIRDKTETGMGNYATGISVQYQYQEKLDFIKNAEQIQKRIYDKLNNPVKKYFLLQFMGQIEPTLIDAVYFAACSNYANKTAGMFCKMFGYSGNPKGISITNLTKLPIETKFKGIQLTEFLFVPPLVLNAQRIIGIASYDHKMTVSLHINKDNAAEGHRKFFYQGMEYLKRISLLSPD